VAADLIVTPDDGAQGPGGGPVSRRRALAAVAIVAIVAVWAAAGALLWHPWQSLRPVPPTSPAANGLTATSIRIRWDPPTHGAKPTGYLIARDSGVVGEVAARADEFVDRGLVPGSNHAYVVVSIAGHAHSAPSQTVSARSLAPSPGRLVAVSVQATAATIRWSPPPSSPPPDGYVVTRNGRGIATLAGASTSYSSTGLRASTTYTYQVSALWGSARSDRPASVALTTAASDAPLQGPYEVRYLMVSTPGGDASGTVGQSWEDPWAFVPMCAAASCPVRATGWFSPPLFANIPLSVGLSRAGDSYTGSVAALVARCGPAPGVRVDSTFTLSITQPVAAPPGAPWTSWRGMLTISSPYTSDGQYYCPEQTWTMSLIASKGGSALLPPAGALPRLAATIAGGSRATRTTATR
jgi:hypothetical protein